MVKLIPCTSSFPIDRVTLTVYSCYCVFAASEFCRWLSIAQDTLFLHIRIASYTMHRTSNLETSQTSATSSLRTKSHTKPEITNEPSTKSINFLTYLSPATRATITIPHPTPQLPRALHSPQPARTSHPLRRRHRLHAQRQHLPASLWPLPQRQQPDTSTPKPQNGAPRTQIPRMRTPSHPTCASYTHVPSSKGGA
jgi:cell envelope opacity-associated protein A